MSQAIQYSPSAQKVPGPVATAIVKDEVFYGSDGHCRLAPRGEYALEHCNGLMRFRSGADGNVFLLSLDTFLRHLHEGRIALIARKAA